MTTGPWSDRPDAASIVRRHWKDAEVFLLASREPCVTIRDNEVARIDRLLHGGSLDDLAGWKRPACWLLAVMLCPGDTTAELAAYVKREGWDADRIHFYLHPDTSLDALEGWAAAGVPLERVDDDVADWKRLHKLLGLALNLRILADHG